MKKVLTIAGSDPSGGAGVQADLKTFSARGVYGMAVVTSLTAQNTVGVQGVHDIPAEFVGKQMDSVLSDIRPEAVKTGMLSNAGITRVVAQRMKRHRIRKLVVDPVMVSKGGAPLLDDEGREALVSVLFPLTFLLTPNIPEAEAIAKTRIRNLKDMEKASKAIQKMGPKNVLVKGGHLGKNPTDVLFDGKNLSHFPMSWVDTKNTHGTGCTLSAAITAELAKGLSLHEAVQRAKEYLQSALRHSLSIGEGIGPLNHLALFQREAEKNSLLEKMYAALALLKKEELGLIIPEVQSNLAAALPGAISWDEVVAFPSRIIKDGPGVAVIHHPAFGASRHIANVVLTNMRYDPAKKACMNVLYDEAVLKACKKLKLSVASFDRAREPKTIRDQEGSTLEWGVKEAIEGFGGKVPDIIFDKGGVGKEAMVRVSANGPLEVARVVVKIKKELVKG